MKEDYLHPMKEGYFRNRWTAECRTEEFKSRQMWQIEEAYLRSKICTLKVNANAITTKSNRTKNKLIKAESGQKEHISSEMEIKH